MSSVEAVSGPYGPPRRPHAVAKADGVPFTAPAPAAAEEPEAGGAPLVRFPDAARRLPLAGPPKLTLSPEVLETLTRSRERTRDLPAIPEEEMTGKPPPAPSWEEQQASMAAALEQWRARQGWGQV